MKKFTAIAAAFAICVGASAQAATVTYRLYTNELAQGANTYKLTAQVTGADAFGLASYGVQLVGDLSVATGSILTTNNNSLRGTDIETGVGGDPGPAGFTLLRSADDNNAATGSNGIQVTGSQDTTDSSAHLIRGFGMEAGTAAGKGLVGSFPEGSPWGNAGVAYLGRPLPPAPGEFEIARGTLAAVAVGVRAIDFIGTPTAVTGANVFTSADGVAVAPATIERIFVEAVPEPATLAMAGLGLLGLVAVGRRK